jgi:lipopolysaccharide transport system ATP-binding protein
MIQDGPSPEVVSAYLNSDLGTTAVREWPDPANAPGSEVVRLRAVRVRTEESQITEVVDIRRPVGIEMEYEVLKPGYMLMPHLMLFNEEGVCAFSAHDVDHDWRRRPRPSGPYVSTAWIPGNLLAEGTMFVHAGIVSLDPDIHQCYEPDVVAFQVVDSMDGDSARGDWGKKMYGVVRPLLRWSTQFGAVESKAAVMSEEEAP